MGVQYKAVDGPAEWRSTFDWRRLSVPRSIDGLQFIADEPTEDHVFAAISATLNNRQAAIVISDLAPNMSDRSELCLLTGGHKCGDIK